MTDRHNRDEWLRMDDATLVASCREERYRASGPGGQRRNKVETAVRLVHEPTGLTVQAEETRSLQENRIRAARRLRERIAIAVRAPFDLAAPHLAPEFVAHRGPRGNLAISPHNPAYPIVIAAILDAVAAAGGSYAQAGRALGISTSQILKFVRSDREVWRRLEEGQRASP